MKDFCHRVTILVQEAPDSAVASLGAGFGGICPGGRVPDVQSGKAVTSEEPGLLNSKPV